MVPEEQVTLPDHDSIRRDLEFMTARWHELDVPVVFEVRAFKEDCAPKSAKFAPDWIEDAVEWCAGMNERGYNIYAVRNPIRHDAPASASDDDIVCAFFLWADCDDPESAGNVKRFDGPKYSAAVITGRKPSTRVHTYWQLAEPCFDLAAWRETQIAIATHFGSDRAVINPSRIMRVGGTVSHPFKKKREKGYEREVTTIRTEYPDERPPVTLDQMRRVFGATATTPESVQIDTGPQSLDRERARIQALSGEEWHNAVIRLVGSYVARGLSDDEIHGLTAPLTLPGYTVEQTRREVQVAIDGARRKGWTPEAPPTPKEATQQAIQDFPISTSAEFLSDLRPLEYLIEGLLPVGVAYSLTGYPGHGKTTLALQFALSVARGEEFGFRETSKGSVLIMAGENPYNVKWQYAAALAARELKPEDVDIHFIEGRFSIREWGEVLRQKMERMPNLKLIIVDSLQAFFEGDNDNDNAQMVDMAHSLRQLCDTSRRPAILIIAHPAGKMPSRENLVPRGGGAFLAEIDGNLTVWSQDASQQTLHHSQKFRGAGFEPMEWVMQIHEFDHLTDVKGTPLKLPVSRPETAIERGVREERSETILRRWLETVEAGEPLSVREAAAQYGLSRYRMEMTINTAKEEKLIKRQARKWKLTEGGREFLEDRNAGE